MQVKRSCSFECDRIGIMDKNSRKFLYSILKDLASNLGVKEITFNLNVPSYKSHGDLASNIGLILFANLKSQNPKLKNLEFKSPLELTQEIVKILNTKYKILDTEFDKIEAIAPGFINFYYSKDYLLNQLQAVVTQRQLFGNGKDPQYASKKVMVEFTDPNPFKEFHIGHLYSNTVGESLSRLMESQSATVRRVCYQGDVGLHVAKAIWGIIRMQDQMPSDDAPVQEKAAFLGRCYAEGAKAYEAEEFDKKAILKINVDVYQKEPKIMKFWEKGRAWSLEYFEATYKRLGTKFTGYYFESDAGKIGLEVVKKFLGKVFEESEGAVIFPGKKYGLHNRVFINSLGLPTYEAKELGLAQTKYKDYPYDLSVIITANEIDDYFRVLLKALEFVSPDLAAKTRHISHGMVRLPEGKMSSRTGNVLSGDWLLNEAKARIIKAFSGMDSDTLEKVAVGAVKYALLRSTVGKDIEFSFEESISLEGNSGPYLQYTFARTQSVLKKSQRNPKEIPNPKYEFAPEEERLLRTIYKFPEVVGEAAVNLSPSTVATYLFQLAQDFNAFYQKCPILGSDNESLRLLLTVSAGQVLKNGLNLLGIQVPEKM